MRPFKTAENRWRQGQLTDVDAVTICMPDIDPLLGALGFPGAHAMIGLGYFPVKVH